MPLASAALKAFSVASSSRRIIASNSGEAAKSAVAGSVAFAGTTTDCTSAPTMTPTGMSAARSNHSAPCRPLRRPVLTTFILPSSSVSMMTSPTNR